jgi:hypothetical protein
VQVLPDLMMLMLELFLSTVGVLNSLYVGAEKVFYVEPTGSRTGCPSDDSPCHSLQYYANNSLTIFTNNSKLLFLEGEHGVLNISNVANLSLVGVSLKVKIFCNGKLLYGFYVQEFLGLEVENLTISNSDGVIIVVNGSNVSLSCVDSSLPTFIKEVGLISILNSNIGYIKVDNNASCNIITCTFLLRIQDFCRYGVDMYNLYYATVQLNPP